MDKYTIDLDQLLDDFEYSELTDNSGRERPNPIQERSINNRSSAKADLTTKHSINNVFHSLHEYLNTSISSNDKVVFEEGHSSNVHFDNSLINDIDETALKHNNTVKSKDSEVKCKVGKELNECFDQNDKKTESAKDTVSQLNGNDEKTENLVNISENGMPVISEIYSEILNNVTPKELINSNLISVNNDPESKFNNIENTTDAEMLKDINVTQENQTNTLDEAEILKDVNSTQSNENTNDMDPSKDNEVHVIEKENANSEENSMIESDKCNIENNKSGVDHNEEYLSLIDNMEQEQESTEEDTSMETKFAEMMVTDDKEIKKSLESKEGSVVAVVDKSLDKQEKISLVEIIENKEVVHEEFNENNNSFPTNKDINQLTSLEEESDIYNNAESSETPQIVGFSHEIDVDESELAKMLEDLEEDDDLGDSLPPVSDVKGINDDLGDLEKTIEEENQDCENINNLNEEIEREKKYALGTVSNELTKPCYKEDYGKEILVYNPVLSVVEELKRPEKQTVSNDNFEVDHVTIQETLTTAEETNIPNDDNVKVPDVTTDTIPAETSTALRETPFIDTNMESSKEKPPDPVESLEASQETTPSSLESSQNSDGSNRSNKPQRPQNLPLNNLKTQEEKARKINLIGSPGSTPYNNVYVNKTGSKRHKNEEESDGEYSTSPSPTFSDVSTDSTSTASTVSIEDVERSKNMAKNINAEKENNLEKEARSLQQSRIQGASTKDQNENSQNEPSTGGNLESSENTSNQVSAGQSSEIGQGDPQGNEQWSGPYSDKSWLGKEAPLWIPDADASSCLHCDMKFTMIKRRHHCRACGLVLCSKCCNLKFRLEYLDADARVCQKCFSILSANQPNDPSSSSTSTEPQDSPALRPNPNNPSEYCSTVPPPLQQTDQGTTAGGSNPPSVMVPVGVLKRKGSNKQKHNKSVMFCDGIAPGSDLTNLDKDFNYHDSNAPEKPEANPTKGDENVTETSSSNRISPPKVISNYPKVDSCTKCFIPSRDDGLPPIVDLNKFLIPNAKPEAVYTECTNTKTLVDRLKKERVCFAITTQLFVNVKIIDMNCCINKTAWCFSTEGLINVGNDEIVYLLECTEDEALVPKDLFVHIHNIFLDAMQGNSVKELGLSLHTTTNFLDSKNHSGFVYIKPTFQCLENVIKPKEPSFLVGLLIHRWEIPWAKLFPLRLILRLGAEYRYYPSPIISTRQRDSVFVEIGHTIINLLADFRNYSYTLPQIRGLIIHMEDKNMTINIPRNRYDQVLKAITTAPDHILAFAGNFSPEADSHLVCIQDTQGNENNYTTHAINIHNKPRKITGASFIIFNGSLKPNAGYTAKSNIIEDGLMIQILPETMVQIRDNLRTMKDHTITCGVVNSSEETVKIVWGDNDVNFNVGISSPVDLMDMKGIPSIRVHNGKEYVSNTGTRVIRWTEVFILQNTEEDSKNQDPVDVSKVSESIAKASCNALVNYLELLLSNHCSKIGIRVTLQADNVSYLAGSNGKILPPIYMKSLDDSLIPILHKLTSNSLGDHVIVLELILRILSA